MAWLDLEAFAASFAGGAAKPVRLTKASAGFQKFLHLPGCQSFPKANRAARAGAALAAFFGGEFALASKLISPTDDDPLLPLLRVLDGCHNENEAIDQLRIAHLLEFGHSAQEAAERLVRAIDKSKCRTLITYARDQLASR